MTAYLLLAAEMIAIHRIGPSVPFLQLLLLRSLGGAVLVAIFSRRVGLAVFRTRRLRLHVLRSSLSVAGLSAFVYAFAHVPLLDATALTYTTALFMTAFSALILHERVGPTRWLAVPIGLVGAMVIIQPAFAGWNWAYLLALAAPALNASALAVTKLLERTDSALTVMAYFATASIIWSIPGLVVWQTPERSLWPWLAAVVILGPVGTYLRILAVQAADMSILAPYDYVRLLVSVCVGVVLFHEIPDATAAFGAIIIVLSCLLVTRRKRRLPAE